MADFMYVFDVGMNESRLIGTYFKDSFEYPRICLLLQENLATKANRSTLQPLLRYLDFMGRNCQCGVDAGTVPATFVRKVFHHFEKLCYGGRSNRHVVIQITCKLHQQIKNNRKSKYDQ